MLLNNPSKSLIKEKLKSIKKDNTIRFKKNNIDELNVDDVYTTEHSNIEKKRR